MQNDWMPITDLNVKCCTIHTITHTHTLLLLNTTVDPQCVCVCVFTPHVTVSRTKSFSAEQKLQFHD